MIVSVFILINDASANFNKRVYYLKRFGFLVLLFIFKNKNLEISKWKKYRPITNS
jgi:hypothetical protein